MDFHVAFTALHESIFSNAVACSSNIQMAQERPPSLDLVAASRWALLPLLGPAKLSSPWLHEEVARRMEERLAFIKLQPMSWVCWDPVRAGLNALSLLKQRYSKAKGFLKAFSPQETA